VSSACGAAHPCVPANAQFRNERRAVQRCEKVASRSFQFRIMDSTHRFGRERNRSALKDGSELAEKIELHAH
jgi:hypothetical protein